MISDGIAAARAAQATRRLARVTFLATALLIAVAAGLGGLALGPSGAASAALGVALSGVLFGGGLLGLHRPQGRATAMGPVAVAFALRIVVYALTLALVNRVDWVHGPSLALATAASIAALLAVEIATLARLPGAEVEPSARRSTHGTNANGA
jgi:membrane associated rhomboid family serine protease